MRRHGWGEQQAVQWITDHGVISVTAPAAALQVELTTDEAAVDARNHSTTFVVASGNSWANEVNGVQRRRRTLGDGVVGPAPSARRSVGPVESMPTRRTHQAEHQCTSAANRRRQRR